MSTKDNVEPKLEVGPEEALLSAARDALIAGLVESGMLAVTKTKHGHPTVSNADGSSRKSREIALHMANALQAETAGERAAGQTLGANFERAVAKFLETTFPHLAHLRPGNWNVQQIGSRGTVSGFAQYEHLSALDAAAKDNLQLRTALGNAYAISPDIVVGRWPEKDDQINLRGLIVDSESARHADLRESVQERQILHAVVSCKWSMRTDRSQNARSEALNLIRNRKGRTPHIVVVAAEPMPARLASLALGTGDLDCVYHLALPQLRAAIRDCCDESTNELVDVMVEGKRLKDLTDLPLDLAV